MRSGYGARAKLLYSGLDWQSSEPFLCGSCHLFGDHIEELDDTLNARQHTVPYPL